MSVTVPTASDAPFLDALAACLGAGAPLPDALSRIEPAGFEAARWVQRIRPFAHQGSPVENALRAARAIDATEHAILALAVTPEAVQRVLHALALRRRRRDALGRAVLRGLVGPFLIAALTVVLDPLPNLIGSGSYFGPVFLGLLVLGLATAFVVAGVPALLRSPTYGPRMLFLCARLPGLGRLAAYHAEAELVTVAAPFAARSDVANAGLLAASTMLAWSPLGEKVRLATLASETAPPSAFPRLAPYLTLATNLSAVSGAASDTLAGRLAARGEELSTELTARLRLVVRVAAYALVVLLSLQSLASMVSRAMPGGTSLLPGAVPSEEQKELEEIMKELEGPSAPPPAKK